MSKSAFGRSWFRFTQSMQTVVRFDPLTVLALPALFVMLVWATSAGATFNGYTTGSFAVDDTGASVYSIPIAVPPGRGGMQPSLSLTYNNRGDNGLLGLGWRLDGLSAIHRCAKTVVQDGVREAIRYDAADKFCLDGQRLIAVAGTYGADGTEYRTEVDTFSKIISHGSTSTGPQYFEVRAKSGQSLFYGFTADSRIELAKSQNKIRLWALNEVQDVAGNYITISYIENNNAGSFRPDRIDYAGNSITQDLPTNSVRFVYEARPDETLGWAGEWWVREDQILRKVQVFSDVTFVNEYRLSYVQSGPAQQSTLQQIVECDAQANCKNPTEFDWSPLPIGVDTTNTAYWGAYPDCDIYPGDYNGDGITDLFFHNKSGTCGNWAFSWVHYASPTGFLPGNQAQLGTYSDCGVYPADYNGDGLTDIFFHNTSGACGNWANSWVHYASETGFLPGNQAVLGGYGDCAVVPGDFNGDGRADLFFHNKSGSCGNWSNSWVKYSKGNDFEPTLYLPPLPGYPDCNAYGGDYNGDGMTDLFFHNKSGVCGGQAFSWVQYATTAGLASGGIAQLGTYADCGVYPADYNGDGLTDLFFHNKSGVCGNWASSWVHYASPISFVSGDHAVLGGYGDCAVLPGDFNGDGKSDIFFHNKSGNCGNWSSSWITYSKGKSFEATLYAPPLNAYSDCDIHVGDFNGDSQNDLYFHNKSSVCGGTNSGWVFYGNGPAGDYVTKITNGAGASVEIDYGFLTDGSVYTKGSGAVYPEVDFSAAMCVARTVRTDDGIGGEAVAEYAYGGARLHLQGRGFLGFGWTTQTDVETGIVTRTEFRQDFPFIGETAGARSYLPDAGGEITLARTANTWTEVANNGGLTWFPYVASALAEDYELNDGAGNAPVTATVSDTLFTTDVGNEVVDYGHPNTITVKSYAGSSTSGTLQRQQVTTNVYAAADTANWILGRLTQASVQSTTYGAGGLPAASQTRTSSFSYFSDGLLQSETIEPGGSDWLTTTYAYDTYGNRTTATVTGADISGSRVTTTVWGERDGAGVVTANGRFPVEVTNALNHTVERTYDARFGLVSKTVDANGLVATTSFDGFGRVTQSVRPDGTRAETSYALCGGDPDCPSLGAYSVSSVEKDAAGVQMSAPSTIYFDRLDREIRRKTEGFAANTKVFADTAYDGRGNTASVSRPYDPDDVNDPPQLTSYTYDALARVTVETAPAAVGSRTVTTGYDGLTVDVTEAYTDPDSVAVSRTARTLRNALGQTVSVTEDHGGATAATTTQTYDPFDNLLTTTGPTGAQVAMTYDLRGRQLTLNDPNTGTWTYAYNVLGELLTQTDAKGQILAMTYDVLGRMTARTEKDAGLVLQGTSTWTYDTAANGLGLLRLAEYRDGGGTLIHSRELSYDSLSRVVSEVQKTGAGAGQKVFTTASAYDADTGRLSTLTYPLAPGDAHAALVLAHDYNARGYPTQVRDNAVGGTVYWQAQAVDAEGMVTQFLLGNGVSTSRDYELQTGHLSSILSTSSGGVAGDVQYLTYSFDAAGNVYARSDLAQDRSERFTYDGHSRMASSTLTNTATQTVLSSKSYSYDLAGNILSKTGIGSYSYGAGNVTGVANDAGPHAVTAAGGKSYKYDDNGNLIARWDNATVTAELNVAWTVYNKPSRFTDLTAGTNSRAFTYGVTRQRVRQDRLDALGAVTSSIWYVGELLEYDDASQQTKAFIFAGGARVAFLRHFGLVAGAKEEIYLHQDHLGSTDTVTNAAGGVSERLSYDPHGLRRDADWQDATGAIAPAHTARGFTGHEHLDSLKLVHMNGRVYDPVIGRFLSSDPAYQNLTGTQTLNRYSYVLNNPLSYTDPSGYFFKKIFKAVKKVVKKAVKAVKKVAKAAQKALAKNEILRAAVVTATAYFTGPAVLSVIGTTTVTGVTVTSVGSLTIVQPVLGYTTGSLVASAGVTGFISGLVGSAGDLEAAALSAVTATAFAGVHFLPVGGEGGIGRIAAHAVVGGGIEELRGGKFAAGALGGALGHGISAYGPSSTTLGRTITAAVAGGVGTELGGGKFANGAITGAFGNLFNNELGLPSLGEQIWPHGEAYRPLNQVPNNAKQILRYRSFFYDNSTNTWRVGFDFPIAGTELRPTYNRRGAPAGSRQVGYTVSPPGSPAVVSGRNPSSGIRIGFFDKRIGGPYFKTYNAEGQQISPVTGKVVGESLAHYPIDLRKTVTQGLH